MVPPPSVDGISAPPPETPVVSPQPQQEPSKEMVKRMRFVLIVLFSIPYVIYLFWSAFLLMVLPDKTGQWDSFIPLGKLVALVGVVVLLLAGFWAVSRIKKAKSADSSVRTMGFVRLTLFLLPGLLVSALVPMLIGGEPGLELLISSPVKAEDFVAPLAIDYTAEEAKTILERRGLSLVNMTWDFQGDAIVDEETVLPAASALYERQGTYTVVATMKLNDGSTRVLRKRVSIPQAVYSYKPVEPIVDQPVFFSVEHLLTEEIPLREARWDFDGDSVPDVTTQDPTVTHTFLRTGSQEVAVTLQFENQTQQRYSRTLEVVEPAPLPFPVTIETVPEFLESPPPFQVVFTVVTDEPIKDVVWDFGDGEGGSGQRIGHTFRERGVFQVTAEVRSQNGTIARLSRVVKIANTLIIPDLTFDGSHTVEGGKITTEAPITIELTPKTGLSLVEFFWEAPKASSVESTDTTLRATYRTAGSYNLILIGKDPEGSVLRHQITLDIKPLSTAVDFDMNPDQGVAPLSVEFDASESRVPNEVITGFVWNFGDGGGDDQRLDSAKVTHIFKQAGTYTVQLTVFTTTGNEYIATKTILVRAPFLDACFLMSRQEGDAPLGIRFDRGCSTGNPVSVLWDFGDGSQSDDMGPMVDHVFETPGKNYTVTLTLRDDNGIVSTFDSSVHTR